MIGRAIGGRSKCQTSPHNTGRIAANEVGSAINNSDIFRDIVEIKEDALTTYVIDFIYVFNFVFSTN
jgi:hypothetical protein